MIVDSAHYIDGRRVDAEPGDLPPAGGFIWVGLFEPDPEEFDEISATLGLHELAVEDATHADQRPKLEVYGDAMFIAARTAGIRPHTHDLILGELQIFVAADSIVVVRHGEAGELTRVRARLERDPDTLKKGPIAVVQAILDQIVDDYAPVVDLLDVRVEALEEEVFSDDGPGSAEELYELKREVLHLLGATRPLGSPLERLATGRVPVRGDAVYFRDILDNLTRVVDRLETYRELLTSILQANLAQVAIRQNEDMRKISAWVAIAASPTVVAGIYGMNFRRMPELDWTFGYPFALALILAGCGVLFVLFRRAGWL